MKASLLIITLLNILIFQGCGSSTSSSPMVLNKLTSIEKPIRKSKKSYSANHSRVLYPKEKYTVVDILYATDRKVRKDNKKRFYFENFYSSQRGKLQYGVAEVTIPKKHKFGAMERPNEYFGTQKVNRYVIVQKIEEINAKEFSNILQLKLAFIAEDDIMIFIHGFNNTFGDAIRRTAQLTYDLKFKGIPMTYSWPSQGSGASTYMQDEASVQYTTPHLVSFLSEVIKNKGSANIHIIGHSMGTRALTNALKEISYIYPGKHVFKNIILAAPDIDRDVFQVNLLPYIKKTTDMITLYASSDDSALKFSKTLHIGERLGQSDNIFIYEGLNTIDASGVDTSGLGHSYFAEKEIIVNDLKAVIHKSLPPQKREKTLIQKLKDKLIYWKIKI